jgi:2-keto-4-pentenoate hydratase/2-oxohepta-3-ene-1,7-dioic acid hydratase in catechol pathway
MLLARYIHQGLEAYGIVDGEELRELACSPYEGFETTGTITSLREVSLLPPCRPEKIVAVGLNYSDHAAELNHPLPEEPVLFPPRPYCPMGVR